MSFSQFLQASEDHLACEELDSARYVYHCGTQGQGIAAVLDKKLPVGESEAWTPLSDEQLSEVLAYQGDVQNGALWGVGIYAGSKTIASKFKGNQQAVCYEFYLPAGMHYLDLAWYDFEVVDASIVDPVFRTI